MRRPLRRRRRRARRLRRAAVRGRARRPRLGASVRRTRGGPGRPGSRCWPRPCGWSPRPGCGRGTWRCRWWGDAADRAAAGGGGGGADRGGRRAGVGGGDHHGRPRPHRPRRGPGGHRHRARVSVLTCSSLLGRDGATGRRPPWTRCPRRWVRSPVGLTSGASWRPLWSRPGGRRRPGTRRCGRSSSRRGRRRRTAQSVRSPRRWATPPRRSRHTGMPRCSISAAAWLGRRAGGRAHGQAALLDPAGAPGSGGGRHASDRRRRARRLDGRARSLVVGAALPTRRRRRRTDPGAALPSRRCRRRTHPGTRAPRTARAAGMACPLRRAETPGGRSPLSRPPAAAARPRTPSRHRSRPAVAAAPPRTALPPRRG